MAEKENSNKLQDDVQMDKNSNSKQIAKSSSDEHLSTSKNSTFSILDLLKKDKNTENRSETNENSTSLSSQSTDSNSQLKQQNIFLQNMIQAMLKTSSSQNLPKPPALPNSPLPTSTILPNNQFFQKNYQNLNLLNPLTHSSILNNPLLQQNSSSPNTLTLPILNQPTNVTFTGLGGAAANMFNPTSTNLSLIARRRKARTVFSDAQLNGLEARFLGQRYLSTEKCLNMLNSFYFVYVVVTQFRTFFYAGKN